MKLLLPCLVAAALASGLTALVLELARPDGPARWAPDGRELAASPTATSTAAEPASERRSDASLAPVESLETAQRLTALEARLAELESALLRRPVEVAREETPAASGTAALDPSDPEARGLVLEVLAAEEERERAERETRRAELRLDLVTSRAEAVANELGLGAQDREQLLEVYLMEDEQRDAARDSIRETGDWDAMRAEMDAVRAWKADELVARFGADVAGQIERVEDEQRPPGRFGRGGRGGGF